MRQFIADVHNRSEEGATAAEYVFLLIFVAMAATFGMAILGDGLIDEFRQTSNSVEGAGGTVGTQSTDTVSTD